MTITIDTNLLVRLIVADDLAQTQAARSEVLGADRVVITLVSFCETIWVLKTRFGFGREDMAAAIDVLLEIPSLIVDRPTLEYGLHHMRQGGDFTDGIIAYEGQALGGQVFVSFDRKAVRQLNASGLSSRLPQRSID